MLTDIQVYKIITGFTSRDYFENYTTPEKNAPNAWIQKGFFIFQAINEIDNYSFRNSILGPFSDGLNDEFYNRFKQIGKKKLDKWDKVKLKGGALKKIERTKYFMRFDTKWCGNSTLTQDDWVYLSSIFLYYFSAKGVTGENELLKKVCETWQGNGYRQFGRDDLVTIRDKFFTRMKKLGLA